VLTPALGRYINGVEYASMTSLLQGFPRQLEHEHGGPIHELDEVNAAELLSDLSVFLGLSDHNRRKVLGARAATHIDQALNAQAGAMLKHQSNRQSKTMLHTEGNNKRSVIDNGD
jgi:hypothetical protein